MPACPEAESALKAGDLTAALTAVKNAIRKNPGDADLRFLLFQTVALAGDWEGASSHLVTYNELVSRQSPLPVLFNDVLGGEVQRKLVFSGELQPTIFGEPQEWLAFLVQALAHSVKGETEAASSLKAQALEQAPAAPGTLNGEPFAWLMDGDSRLGPVLEVIHHGKYYWMPQNRVRSLEMEPPTNIRDAIWTPTAITLTNGSSIHGFIPARYPGAASWTSDALKLGRATGWDAPAEGYYCGTGQRVLMTDAAEISWLDVRSLEFTQE